MAMQFKTTFSLIIGVIITQLSFAQCGTTGGWITINSEADFDLISDCDTIYGSLLVDAPMISNLEGMEQIEFIEEHFHLIENLSLLSLQGLNSLSRVGGDFLVISNFTMQNLNGSFLDSIGGDFYLEANLGLDNLEGMSELLFVGGDLTLVDGNQQSLDGLQNIHQIGGSLNLYDQMPDLTNIQSLAALDTIGGDFPMVDVAFTSTEGLESLKYIGGDLEVSNNVLLSNLNAFNSLEEVGQSLIIDANLSLTQIDSLYALTMVGQDLIITDNFALNSCCGINQLLPSDGPNIGGVLTLGTNGALCSDEPTILEDCFVGIGEPLEPMNLLVYYNGGWQNQTPESLRISVYTLEGKLLDKSLLHPQDAFIHRFEGAVIIKALGLSSGYTQSVLSTLL